MAGVTNNLYPPIINTYMPAFVINDSGPTTCRIYFSLSIYNSLKEIKNVQVTISNQNTNASVLNKQVYPSGIKLCSIGIDNSRQSDDKYYIDIISADLEQNFQINQYYKIQLRFTNIGAPDPSSSTALDAWLTENTGFFSEWSTICLIRGISQPSLQLLHLDNSENTSMALTQSTLSLIGRLTFKDPKEKDTLKSYHAKLYDNNSNLLSDSGIIYPNGYNNVNEINYVFNYMLEDGMSYILQVEVTTRNLYTITQQYHFTIIQNTLDKLPAEISTDLNKEMGSIQVKLAALNAKKFTGYVTFRRASSRTNFAVWEDVHTVAVNKALLNYTWYDYTVESGVWYKYCAQRTDERNNRGIVITTQEPIMMIFEDMFFCANQKQLRIKFNPQISSYKKNISESKTDTIGSQYPFIKRNGAMEYRQFAISGMITLHTDYQETFITKNDLYGNSDIVDLYDQYNQQERIHEYNDYIQEREFREKVIDFLYEDSVKLLRTTTEGNILVRLMDINLTPEAALGRMIYSFSATAYEVDNCTIDNMTKYNIGNQRGKINLSTDEDIVSDYDIKLGQIDGYFAANTDIVKTVLVNKYSYLTEQGVKFRVDHLTKMRLEFKTPPYLIHENERHELEPLGADMPADETTAFGYIAYINQTSVYINPEGIYELGNDINITSLYFPLDTEATLDYMVTIYQEKDHAHESDILYFYNKVGQIWGVFKYNDSVFDRIWRKYYGDYRTYYQKLISINGVRIETEPNTVCWVKDSLEADLKRIVINDSGSLSLYDDNAVIEGLYFSGVHLDPATENDKQREILPENKFLDTGIQVDSLEEIKFPIMNGVYSLNKQFKGNTLEELEPDPIITLPDGVEIASDDKYAILLQQLIDNSDRYIFYHGHWYIFTEHNDVLCDTEGIVDYWCEVMKGVYLS